MELFESKNLHVKGGQLFRIFCPNCQVANLRDTHPLFKCFIPAPFRFGQFHVRIGGPPLFRETPGAWLEDVLRGYLFIANPLRVAV